MSEMNFSAVIISTLVFIICVLIGLLQHYYVNFQNVKKSADVRHNSPVFEDMILTTERNYYALDYNNEGGPHESEIMNTLNEALQTRIDIVSETLLVSLNNNNLCDATDSEVHNTLKAALAYKLSGKLEKAKKLFVHMISLSPENPDVLNCYGEFVEHTRNDIIAADELYFKALTHSPNHEGALMNRARTAHIVDKLDLRILKSIDEKLETLKKLQTDPFFVILMKQAYYLHIYHTVGIEGNTMSLEELRSVLETGKAVADKSIIEHNEILGLELAMKYVKILIRFPAVTVKEILGIHRRVLGHVDPLNSGVFRDNQVFVGSHVPPPPEHLPGLMESYVEWLNSEEAKCMHPIRYAALAHYKLVDIHPFSDGNGRTSRLIMNLILLRAGYPPVMVLKRHREKYYEYLNLANSGDVRPFVRFIAQCTEHMMDAFIWSTQRFQKDITDNNRDISSLDSSTIQVEESQDSRTM